MRTTLLRQLRVSERRHGDKYGGAVTPSRGDYPKLLDDCVAIRMGLIAPLPAAVIGRLARARNHPLERGEKGISSSAGNAREPSCRTY
jgi:hypothetical protein